MVQLHNSFGYQLVHSWKIVECFVIYLQCRFCHIQNITKLF